LFPNSYEVHAFAGKRHNAKNKQLCLQIALTPTYFEIKTILTEKKAISGENPPIPSSKAKQFLRLAYSSHRHKFSGSI
jgi:hypothetical protein